MINSYQLILEKKTEAINAHLISHNKGEGGERRRERERERETERQRERQTGRN